MRQLTLLIRFFDIILSRYANKVQIEYSLNKLRFHTNSYVVTGNMWLH